MTSLNLTKAMAEDPFYFLHKESAPELDVETFEGEDWQLVPDPNIDEDYAKRLEANGWEAQAAKETDKVLHEVAKVGRSYQSFDAVRTLYNRAWPSDTVELLKNFKIDGTYRIPEALDPELQRARKDGCFGEFYVVRVSSSPLCYLVIATLDNDVPPRKLFSEHTERLFLIAQFGSGFTSLRSALKAREVRHLYELEATASRQIAEREAAIQRQKSNQKAIRRAQFAKPIMVALCSLVFAVFIVANVLLGFVAPEFLVLALTFGWFVPVIACAGICDLYDRHSKGAITQKVYGLSEGAAQTARQIGSFYRDGETVRIDERLLLKKK